MTDTATLDIYWPKETEHGKWLLYLMKISSTGVNQVECSPKGEINPLNMVSDNIRLRHGGCSACMYTLSSLVKVVEEVDSLIFTALYFFGKIKKLGQVSSLLYLFSSLL